MGRSEEAGVLNVRLRLSGVGDRGEGEDCSVQWGLTGQQSPQASSILCAAVDGQSFPVCVYSGRNCQNGISKIKQRGPTKWNRKLSAMHRECKNSTKYIWFTFHGPWFSWGWWSDIWSSDHIHSMFHPELSQQLLNIIFSCPLAKNRVLMESPTPFFFNGRDIRKAVFDPWPIFTFRHQKQKRNEQKSVWAERKKARDL